MTQKKTFSLLLGIILGLSVLFQGLYLEGMEFISYQYLFMILISVLFIVYAFITGINLKPDCFIDWFVITAIPVYFICSLTAVSLWDSVSCAFRYVCCYLLYFMSKDLLKNNSLLFYKSLYYISAVISGYGLYLGITGAAFDSKKGLLLSVFRYHNASAVFFSCIFLIGIYLIGKSSFTEKVLITLFNTLLVSSVIYSQSRGGWLVFGIFLLIYIYCTKKSELFSESVVSIVAPFAGVLFTLNGFMNAFFERNSDFSCAQPLRCYIYIILSLVISGFIYLLFTKTLVKKIITPKVVGIAIPVVIVLGIVYLFLFAPDSIKDRISEFSLSSSTVSERTMFFKDAFAIFKDKPLAGIGGDCWKYVYPAYQTQFYTVAHPHSIVFEYVTDAGILGLILFVLLVCGFVLSVIKCKGDDKMPAKLIAGLILVHSLFDFDTDYFTIFSLLIICLAIINSDVTSEKKSSKLFILIPVVLIIWSGLNIASDFYYNKALDGSTSGQPISYVYDCSKKSVDFMPVNQNRLTSHGNICLGMALNVDRNYINEAKETLEKSYGLNEYHYETINQLANLSYYTGQFKNSCDLASLIVRNQPFIPATYEYAYRIYRSVLDYGVQNNNYECIKLACEMMINNYHYAHSVSSKNRARIEMGTETHDAFNEAKDYLSQLKVYGVE